MSSFDKRFWTVIGIVLVILAVIGIWRNVSAPSAIHTPAADSAAIATTTMSAATDPSYTYLCDEGKSVIATFHLPEDRFVNLHMSDGRVAILGHAMSASGARYANVDESFVFWNKGDTAFITENGTTTFDGCIVENH